MPRARWIAGSLAAVSIMLFTAGAGAQHALAAGRGAWLQVARGSVTLNGTPLSEGDGAAIEDEPSIAIKATVDAEVLLFDLA